MYLLSITDVTYSTHFIVFSPFLYLSHFFFLYFCFHYLLHPFFFFFFFLMIRRPPRSTLFPYTPLSRSLEGLPPTPRRFTEAGWILRTFAHYIRDGLIPNMFPEGKNEGLYHTADATLWYFHAIEKYLAVTNDRDTLVELLPKLIDIVEHHVRGTRFGIGVDPADGLLRQGEEGYQLTWMDAKVGDWVVTPRRGKAVEINALWYNALRLMEIWVREELSER